MDSCMVKRGIFETAIVSVEEVATATECDCSQAIASSGLKHEYREDDIDYIVLVRLLAFMCVVVEDTNDLRVSSSCVYKRKRIRHSDIPTKPYLPLGFAAV